MQRRACNTPSSESPEKQRFTEIPVYPPALGWNVWSPRCSLAASSEECPEVNEVIEGFAMPRGQTAHLEGKRTGRPKGTGSRSRLLPDMRWAYETIAEPEARPPSAGAKWCKDLAVRDPAGFLTLLGSLEAAENGETVPRRSERGSVSGASLTDVDDEFFEGRGRRLKGVTVQESLVLSWLKAKEPNAFWALVPPFDAHLVGCQVDTARRRFRFLIHSEEFPEVEDGEPIEELVRERV
jgi:hypothetical protein